MYDDSYQEPKELTFYNPFEKQIKALGNKQGELDAYELLSLIETMGEYIGKLESRISRINTNRVE